jgi:drug/metabolite transporter (DMT)-like permease
MVLSLFFWVSMNTFAKMLAGQYPVIQMVFFRNIVVVAVIIPWLVWHSAYDRIRSQKPVGHLCRAATGITSMICIFVGLGTLPLSDVVALTYAAPLFITMLSVPFLGETVGIRRWCAILVGFVGVVIMMKPTGVMEPASFIVLFGAFCFAMTVTITRKLSATESSLTIVFIFSCLVSLATASALPWYWITPDGNGLMLLLGVAVFGGLAQATLIMSIRAAPVSVIAPLDYLSLIIAMGFDLLIWNTLPVASTLVGAAVIVSMGLYIIYRDAGPEARTAMATWRNRGS